MMAGKAITAVGVTEPGAGSDVAGIRTRAVRDGSDYVLNGTKMFITNGVHGDLYFVAARTDPEAKGSRAITMFIVEKGTPGFKVGRALDKTGWRSSDTAELVFEDCRVPAENVLGEPNRGFYSIMANFQTERLVIGAMAHGRGARGDPAHLRACRARAPPSARRCGTSRRSASVCRGGWPRSRRRASSCITRRGSMPRAADCVAQVSMVKALAGDLVNPVLYDCVQFHGGMGFVRETAVERMARDARVQSIGGGASEVMLEEIAKRFGAGSPTDAVYFGTTRNGPIASTAHSVPPARAHSPTASLAAALSLAGRRRCRGGRCGRARWRASRWPPGSARAPPAGRRPDWSSPAA